MCGGGCGFGRGGFGIGRWRGEWGWTFFLFFLGFGVLGLDGFGGCVSGFGFGFGFGVESALGSRRGCGDPLLSQRTGTEFGCWNCYLEALFEVGIESIIRFAGVKKKQFRKADDYSHRWRRLELTPRSYIECKLESPVLLSMLGISSFRRDIY